MDEHDGKSVRRKWRLLKELDKYRNTVFICLFTCIYL